MDDLVFDRESVRAVDRDAVEHYGIPGIVLMENAALGLLGEACSLLYGRPGPRTAETILIACGGGNNGGDGYALARHLHNIGERPLLLVVAEPRDGTDAAINRRICRRMSLEEVGPESLDDEHVLIVDAIFGTGLTRPVEGRAADVIERINAASTDMRIPVLAVDVPSGLDCETGLPLGPCVRAARTVTFVGTKRGFRAPGAHEWTGEVIVAGIGAPHELVSKYGVPGG